MNIKLENLKIVEAIKIAEIESLKNELINENLNISDVIGSYKNGVEWFDKLSPYHREKVRERYNLKSLRLKITDKILNDIYQKELELPKGERVGDLY